MEAMSSSLSSLCGMPRLTPRRKVHVILRARAHSSASDEGRPNMSIVDTSLGVLQERMEILSMKERFERSRVRSLEGWNYQPHYDSKLIKRNNKLMTESIELAETVVSTFGLTILSCTVCLSALSLVLHLI